MTITIEDTTAANAWCRNEETQVASPPPAPVTPDEWGDGALGGGGREKKGGGGGEGEEEDAEFVLPTAFAMVRLLEVVQSTAYGMMASQCPMPEGSVMADYTGGIRIEWWHDREYCVTLVIGNNEESKSYVFVKLDEGDPGRVNERVLPVRLASQLKTLSEM